MNERINPTPEQESQSEYDQMVGSFIEVISGIDQFHGASLLSLVFHEDKDGIGIDPNVAKFLDSIGSCVDPYAYLDEYPVVSESDVEPDTEFHERTLARFVVDGEVKATVFSTITFHGASATEQIKVISGRPKFETLDQVS